MTSLLARAESFARLTGGAFDITYAAVGQLYDYRAGTRPSPEALARACRAVGWRFLALDRGARTVRFTRPGMRIDLGGFAKGYAVDNATRILRAHGIRHAMVSAGGDSRVIGDRRGRPWTIGIRDPRGGSSDVVAVLPLEDVSISTSGDYERYFDDGGERFHHLIDPATGRSPGERAQRDRAGRGRADQRSAVEGGVRARRRQGPGADRLFSGRRRDRRRRRRCPALLRGARRPGGAGAAMKKNESSGRER